MTRPCLIAVTALLVTAAAAAAQPRPEVPVESRMAAWSQALGVDCAFCHVGGNGADGTLPTHAFAARMGRMVAALNAGPLRELGGVTCWTCHRGRRIPARLPATAWQAVRADHAADFQGREGLALTMSVYAASLGVACDYCHRSGDWAAAATPAHGMVARMLPVFDEIPKHFTPSRQPTTQCFLCHQGAITPARAPGPSP